MPAYEYECKDCNICFTVYLTLAEQQFAPKIKCPHCGSDGVVKKFSGFFAKTSKKS